MSPLSVCLQDHTLITVRSIISMTTSGSSVRSHLSPKLLQQLVNSYSLSSFYSIEFTNVVMSPVETDIKYSVYYILIVFFFHFLCCQSSFNLFHSFHMFFSHTVIMRVSEMSIVSCNWNFYLLYG